VVWQKLISAHCQHQNIRIRGSVGGRDANGWRVQVLETEERRVSRPLGRHMPDEHFIPASAVIISKRDGNFISTA